MMTENILQFLHASVMSSHNRNTGESAINIVLDMLIKCKLLHEQMSIN